MKPASVGHHCPECVSTQGQQVRTARSLAPGRPQLTMALIAVSVLVYLGQRATGSFETNGVLRGLSVRDGEWWRIVSSGFLHGSEIHLIMNMFALWIFGQPLENGIGKLRFGLIYLAGLLGGSFAVLAFGFDQPTLGASGAVLGCAGGLAGVLWARGVNFITETSLGFLFVVNLGLPLLVPRISFWGHVGGVLGGFVAGLLLAWLPERMKLDNKVAIVSVAALCASLFAAGVIAAQASGFV